MRARGAGAAVEHYPLNRYVSCADVESNDVLAGFSRALSPDQLSARAPCGDRARLAGSKGPLPHQKRTVRDWCPHPDSNRDLWIEGPVTSALGRRGRGAVSGSCTPRRLRVLV